MMYTTSGLTVYPNPHESPVSGVTVIFDGKSKVKRGGR